MFGFLTIAAVVFFVLFALTGGLKNARKEADEDANLGGGAFIGVFFIVFFLLSWGAIEILHSFINPHKSKENMYLVGFIGIFVLMGIAWISFHISHMIVFGKKMR